MKKLFTAAAAAIVGALALASFASADGSHPTVFVGAHTGFDRTFNWTVTKTDNVHGSVTLAQNEDFSVSYTVTVSPGTPPFTDSNWSVQDGIVLTNPFGLGLTALTDVTASATQGTTTTDGTIEVCATDSRYQNPVAFPYNGTLVGCHYVISLPSGTSGTVTATFQGVTASTPFDFVTLDAGQPRIFNDQVTVSDTLGGTLGQLTAPLAHPVDFTYSVPVDTSQCRSYDMPNTASVLDGHGTSLAHATDTVHVTVTCPHVNGCTLTQGYWKTHSIYGPAAKPDATWNLLSNGPNTSFFSSGQTWLQVFNTSPAGGNAYYVLAHQYEAAVLNQLDGASSTAAVDAALATATSFFNTYTPTQAAALSSNSSARKAALAAATTLDNYNSGLIGPGHCNE